MRISEVIQMSLITELIRKSIQDKDSHILEQVIHIAHPDQRYKSYTVMEYDGDVPRLFGDDNSIEMLIPRELNTFYENAVVDAIESGSLFEDKEDIDHKVKYITMTHLPHLGMMHKHMDEPHEIPHAVGMVVGAMHPDGHFGSHDADMENGKNYMYDLTEHGDEKDTSVMDLTHDYLDIKDRSGKGTPVKLKRSLAKVPEEIEQIKEVKAEDTVDEDDYDEIGLDHEEDDNDTKDKHFDDALEDDDDESDEEETDDDEDDEDTDEEGDENGLIASYVGGKIVKHAVKKGAKHAAKKAAKKAVKRGIEKVKEHEDEDDDEDHDKDSDKEKSIEKFLKSRSKDIDVDIEEENGDEFSKSSRNEHDDTIGFDGESAFDSSGNYSPDMNGGIATKSDYEKSNTSERNTTNAFSMLNHSDSSNSSFETKSQFGSVVQKFGSKKPSPRTESYRYREYDEYEYYQETHAMLVKPKKLKPIPRDVIAYIITQKNAIRDSNDQAMIAGYCCSKLEMVDFYLNCLDTHDYRYIVPHNRQYLVQMQNDLNRCLQEILRVKPINRLDRVWRVNVTYPEGWGG